MCIRDRRYLPRGYFKSNSIGEISSVTTNTMESLGDIAARVVMLTTQGILETLMIILMPVSYTHLKFAQIYKISIAVKDETK